MSSEPKPVHTLSDPKSWIDDYGDYLYNLAFSRLHDRAASEDVVQETFLAALRGRERFAGRSTERTWLAGILKNKIIDHLRKMFKEQSDENIDVDAIDPGEGFVQGGAWRGHWIPEQSPGFWTRDPSGGVERREFYEALGHCLKKLTPRLTTVFILHEIEELGTEAICKELNVTPTNLWVMLHRARRQLRQCLEINWIGESADQEGRLIP